MSHRLEKVVDRRLSANEKVSGKLPIPKSVKRLQFVLDRQPFENKTTKTQPACRIAIYDTKDDNYLGGCQWGGGRVEGEGPRPGQRMLWSFAYWPIPKDVKEVRYELEPLIDFRATLDVDLIFEGEIK